METVEHQARGKSGSAAADVAQNGRPSTERSEGGIWADAISSRTHDVLAYRRRSALPLRRGWLLHRALLLADVLGLVLAFAFAALVTSSSGSTLSDAEELGLLVLSLPIWVLLLKLHGLYDRDEERTDHSTVNEIIDVFHVVTIGSWLFFVAADVFGGLTVPLDRLVAFWLAAVILVPTTRATTRAMCRRSLAYTQNAVIVGTGPVARLVARKILSHPEYGINLVGFVDGSPAGKSNSLGGIPILGSPEHLKQLARDMGLERVIIAFTPDSHDYTLDVVRAVRELNLQVDIVPRLFEVLGTSSSVHMLEGLPLVGLPPLRLSPSSRFLKRMLDLVGATLGVLFLAPLFLAIAVAIKVDSPGPVFFRQLRRRAGGKTFVIVKFRTMVYDAEAKKGELEHLSIHANGDPRMFKIASDPRVTRVGAFLRRTSMDELPQLFNVLRGEMSLVGPRPLILEEDRHVENWARKRLDLKPGMTGLWQVLGRSEIPFDEMTKLDYLYVTSWSLKEDLRLILLTLPALLRPRRAY